MLSFHYPLNFYAKILSLLAGAVKAAVAINTFVIHIIEVPSTTKITQISFEAFFYFFSILICFIKRIIYLTLIFKTFCCFFILASKLVLVSLLNSGVVVIPVVLDVLFSISVAFILKVALVARLVMHRILLSTFFSIWVFFHYLSLFTESLISFLHPL